LYHVNFFAWAGGLAHPVRYLQPKRSLAGA
jgi:hypothetical protein